MRVVEALFASGSAILAVAGGYLHPVCCMQKESSLCVYGVQASSLLQPSLSGRTLAFGSFLIIFKIGSFNLPVALVTELIEDVQSRCVTIVNESKDSQWHAHATSPSEACRLQIGALTRFTTLPEPQSHIHAHTHARMHTRTHACTHARTHAHTHVCVDFIPEYQIHSHQSAHNTSIVVVVGYCFCCFCCCCCCYCCC